MKTDDFIEQLARDIRAVAPLQRPSLRAATWMLGALVYMGALTLMMTSSRDVAVNAIGWRFLFPQIAATIVSAAAATAAFASVVPGTSSARVVLWPVAALTLWLGVLFVGSLQEWQAVEAVDLVPRREWQCVAMIGLGGALPALGMALMLRHGAPMTPRITTALAMLAAAGLANVVACVSHPHTSSAVVLIWHGTTVLSLVAVSAWLGRSVFSWDRIRHLN
jgi:hypothetical protein